MKGLLDGYKKMKEAEEIIDILIEKIGSMDKNLADISKKIDKIIKVLEKK